MKHSVALYLISLLLLTSPFTATGDIDVMTQNQYLGTNLDPLIAAPDAGAFNDALLDALAEVAANDFPARAEMLSELIARRLSELVGLQEVYVFLCEPLTPAPAGAGCDDPSLRNAFNDHLMLTLLELAAQGADYVVAAAVQNVLLQVPVDSDLDGLADILVTAIDRDVVLARSDLAVAAVPFSEICQRPAPSGVANVPPSGCHYGVVAEVETAVGSIAIERGLVGVDAWIDGKSYRFVNTHLEQQNLLPEPPGTPPDVVLGGSIQAAQATELAGLIAASMMFLPTPPGTEPILVGDINSSSEDGPFFDPLFPDPTNFPNNPPILLTPPYAQLVEGVDLLGNPMGNALGPLSDAWDLRPGAVPGFTCCQDQDLANRQSAHDERIDVIFSGSSPEKVKQARVLGSRVSDKTPPPGLGLWPSDHGTVAARLVFSDDIIIPANTNRPRR